MHQDWLLLAKKTYLLRVRDKIHTQPHSGLEGYWVQPKLLLANSICFSCEFYWAKMNRKDAQKSVGSFAIK